MYRETFEELLHQVDAAETALGLANDVLVGRDTHPLYDHRIYNPSEFWVATRLSELLDEVISLGRRMRDLQIQGNWVFERSEYPIRYVTEEELTRVAREGADALIQYLESRGISVDPRKGS